MLLNLELSATDAMMGSHEPLLKVANRAVIEPHVRLLSLAELAAQSLRARNMFEAAEPQTRALLQAVGIDRQPGITAA